MLIFNYRKEECFFHKVFGFLKFGHFFCPFLKNENTFQLKKRTFLLLQELQELHDLLHENKKWVGWSLSRLINIYLFDL